MGRKKRPLSKPPRRMTRKERTRWQRERRIQRNLILVFVAVGIISILVLTYGLIHDLVVNPRRVIARVNGEAVLQRDYWTARRLDLTGQWNEYTRTVILYDQMGITMTAEQKQSVEQTGQQILYELSRVRRQPIDETAMQSLLQTVLVRQGAEQLNIEVTDEDVDLLFVPESEEETPSLGDTLPLTTTDVAEVPQATLSPKDRNRTVKELLSQEYDDMTVWADKKYLGSLHLSRGEYIEIQRYGARMALLQERVKEHLAEGLPETELQVRASHILISEPRSDRAAEAEAALQDGDPFPLVVATYSDDESWRDQAGDLGWITRGDSTLSAELEEAAFALAEPGDHSAIVEDDAGYHIVQLIERDEAGDRVHLRHLLIPAERRSVAEEALQLIEGGEKSFAEVAQAYSEDEATAPQGGILPDWVERGDGTLSPAVEAAAFALTEPEQTSPIVENEDGYHIVQLVERDEENADRVRLRHIWIRTGQGLAQELLAEIESNVLDFSLAVVKYSQDEATAGQAGDIGWITRGDGTLSADLEEASFALAEPGDYSAVIEDEAGYHIVQLVERDEAGDRVHLREILCKKAADLAEEIHTYIVEGDPETIGERFFEMVTEYSDDPSASTNAGDLGWFGVGKMVAEFEKVALNMEPGQISDPVRTEFGYHIIWVQDRDENHPLDEETREQRSQEAFDEWLEGLWETAVIERYPPPTPIPTASPAETALPASTAPITETASP